jgi:23S rRNA (adenine-N6)-dimethyltransferase
VELRRGRRHRHCRGHPARPSRPGVVFASYGRLRDGAPWPGAPGPRWGWHRLSSPWAQRIVVDAGVKPGELVLDIGAGLGSLTEALLGVGARVVAVELHRGRARMLRERFVGQPVTVVQADASDLKLPRRPFRVVANPPFAVVEPLLRRLLAPGSRVYAADLVTSRHAGRRWAGPGAPGAGRWAAELQIVIGRTVPRQAFVPSPPRDAKVLVIRRR